MDLLINMIGLILIAMIIGWFWMSSPKAKVVNAQLIDILVEDGVYSPAIIEVPANQQITLRFIRKDASPCAEKVIFDKLDKSLELTLGQPTDLSLNIADAGEYDFTCEMQMYRGRLIVKAQ